MKSSEKTVFSKGEIIDGKYAVVFFIKRGDHAETYRVKDGEGNILFLKLFSLPSMHRSQIDAEGRVLEARLLQSLDHPNLAKYRDDGELIIGQQKYAYLALDFISGETLAEKIKRETALSVYEARLILQGVLDGLQHLHKQSDPLIHNDLNHLNVMLDLSGPKPVPRIIDFGYARNLSQSIQTYRKEGLNPFYMAPECFNRSFSPQSDLYSAGALLYHLIYGLPPWFVEISRYRSGRQEEVEEMILSERRKPIKQLFLDVKKGAGPDANLLRVLNKALHPNPDSRFRSAEEMKLALLGEVEVEDYSEAPPSRNQLAVRKKLPQSLKEKAGFKQIAGMEEMKDMFQNDVIRALQEPEVFEQYGLTIPNGVLFYGPPGCGKTFFAEKFAEEVGYNFISVKPSDLASIYIHGSQEKIGKLFSDARENAPTILFLDELDAILPNREMEMNHSYASEVNEFLAQMTNCSKDGIFIIGATNRPEKIDPAILRTGRLDKLIYIPPPDFQARKSLFELQLISRPLDFAIDYDALAQLTEGFVSSDIEFLANEAARAALRTESKITQEILVQTIQNNKPSVSTSEIGRFETFSAQLEQTGRDRPKPPPIGFRRNDD